MRGSRRRRPVVPVWFVEAERFRRFGGTASRCLARGLSLPKLLDDAYADCAYADCQGTSFLRRLSGWLAGRPLDAPQLNADVFHPEVFKLG